MTPYTSYLATDGSEKEFRKSDMTGGIRRTPAPAKSIAMDAPSGAEAISASKMARNQQEQITLDGVGVDDKDGNFYKRKAREEQSLKKVNAKTFYLENGVWIDSEFKEDAKIAETRIAFASEAYFDLASKEKDLGQYLALGEQVVIVWKGKVYRITK